MSLQSGIRKIKANMIHWYRTRDRII